MAGDPYQEFAKRVRAHFDEAQIIHMGLSATGGDLIRRLLNQDGWPRSGRPRRTLRGLGKDVGLSPTYLSRVINRHEIISAGAYLRLADHLSDKEAHDGARAS